MSLYDDLGIQKTATTDEIKAAFKKLALKHHPDRGGNEEEFKRIQKAYETLSDDQKRRVYDTGSNGNDFFGGHGGFSSMFDQMFGGFHHHGHHGHQGPQGFPDTAPLITLSLNLTLEDIYFNKTRELEYTCRERCKCIQKCSVCQGRGVQVQIMRIGPIIQQMQSECSNCKGLGASGSCNDCSHQGWKQLRKCIQLNITRNVVHTGRMTIKGIGHQDLHNQNLLGDVVVVFNILNHSVFTKEGNNLKMNLDISWKNSICGTKLTVPHFEGDIVVDTSSFGLIQPNSEHVIKNKGFATEGNLILCFKIKDYPVLTSEQVQKIKEIL
jgi:DnaJ family protein A protein 2